MDNRFANSKDGVSHANTYGQETGMSFSGSDEDMSAMVTLHAHAKGWTDLPIAIRACNGCTACCTLLGVKDLHPAKPRGIACKHLDGNANKTTDPVGQPGCGIYEKRPDSCKFFACCWKIELYNMPLELRPDMSGIVVQVETESDCPAIVVYCTQTDAWRRNFHFMRWFEEKWEQGHNFVFIPAEENGNRQFIPGKGKPVPEFIVKAAAKVWQTGSRGQRR